MVVGKREKIFNGIAGAMYGLAIGDALGAVTEGLSPAQILDRYGRINGFHVDGQVGTDDTEFATYYAGLLHRHGLSITSQNVAQGWLTDIYKENQTYKGAGFSEAFTLQNLKRGHEPPESGRHLHSWSDGLAMCAAVFGCVYPGDPLAAAELSRTFGQVSHAGEGILGGQAVAMAVASALDGKSWDAVFHEVMDHLPEQTWLRSNLVKASQIVQPGMAEEELTHRLYKEFVFDEYFWGDLAPEAVALAFGILMATECHFESSVLAAVNLGRDTDTIAAICGAVAGAVGGIEVVPVDWINRIGAVSGRCIPAVAGQTPAHVAGQLQDLAVGV